MEQLALKLRREWGIDPYAPVDIFSLALEKDWQFDIAMVRDGSNC